MNRHLLSIALTMFLMGSLVAQNNHSQTNFRVGQQVYSDISATGISISMTDNAEGTSIAAQNIGFDFSFNGIVFTQFMIHTDGLLRLGNAAPGSATEISASNAGTFGAVFTSTATNFQNIILPFFTNLVAGSNTPEFHVVTTGAAPNRVCTIQWKNLRDADNPTGGGVQHQFDNLEFQVKLYETSNDIEFVYGLFTPSAATTAGRGAVSGIKATNLSFLGLYRINSFMPFQKAVVFNPTNHGRLNSSYPFRKDMIPAFGLSNRFLGRIGNDVNVGKVYFDSIAPVGNQNTGRVEALIVNEGTNTMNDITVNLQITGSNTHNAAVNIASLGAGASQRVSFPAYNLANKGQQDVQVSVAVAGDERSVNNQLVGKQVISQSHNQTFDFSTNSTLGVGFSGSTNNLTAIKMYGSGVRKIKQVRIPFGSYRNIVNVRIYEDGGTGGSPSSSPLFTSTNFFTTTEHVIIVPIEGNVTVDGDYFIAVQQTTSTNMVWRIFLNPPIRNNRSFNSNTGVSWANDATNPPWEVMAEVYEESQAADIGIERLSSPGCDYSPATDVKVTLRNFSASSIDFSATPTTITGKVTHPSGTEFPFSIQKNSGNLAAGAFEEVTILSNYDFATRGIHRFNARTNLAGDAETGNDSLAFFINNSIAVTRTAPNPVCPLTSVTLTGPAFLANLQWFVEGSSSSATTRIVTPIKTTLVKISGTDYRNCLLQDSLFIEVKVDGLPPRPVLIFGDTILSHRNQFKDTVRVKKLDGHTIQWLGGIGTQVSDSALILNQVSGMQNAKIAAAYTRIVDGCSNISDTLNYTYAPGVLQNSNDPLQTCDSSFYDFSGPTGNTGNNFTRTFTPATPGTKMMLTIYKLELAPNAAIFIHDGPSTSSPRIEALSNVQNGSTILTFISSHESGILTIRYNIGSFPSSGWWAGLTCHTPEVYRTVENGNWISSSTWESKKPGGNYMPAQRPPSKGDDSVYIRHNITLSSSTPMDQIVVEEGATFGIENPTQNFISMPAYKTVPQPEFLVKGTLNISARVQIFGGNGEMIVQGRLNNFGQIDFDSVVFNGTTPQILGDFSGASGSMKRLHINNPEGLTMGSDQEVTGFRFVNGLINTNSETFIKLNASADLDNMAHNGSHINGPLTVELPGGSGDRLFPIGKNGKYRPVFLENNSSSSESSDRFTAEVIEGAPPSRTLPDGITKVSELRFFRITRVGNSGQDFNIAFPYLQDDGITDPSNLTIAKDNGAGAWINIGGTVTGSIPGIIRSDEFNGFSDFVLANKSGGSNPLPVTWVSFIANRQQANAQLEWRTTQEQNCSLYEVERSIDGTNYQKLGSVSCQNSQVAQVYKYTDAAPGKGNFYYRIKQTDKDGGFEYSQVRMLNFDNAQSITVYPNPTRNLLQITGLQTNSEINLHDASGRRVLQTRSGQPILQMQVGHLPAGIYQLSITQSNGEHSFHKIQIVK